MNATLRLTKPYMHGPAVRRLQEFGDLLGFDYGNNDGIFGPSTEQIVIDLQRMLGLNSDGICGPKTWAAILNKIDDNPMNELDGIFDRRGLHIPPRLYARLRTWDCINGITFHQTGCQMPLSPKGWDKLNAHIGITADGKVIIANDPTDMIWHAQSLSHKTIGIEVAGNFAGISGVESTVWKGGGGPNRLNWKMMEALDVAFDWIVDQFKENGSEVKHIFAHRQSAKSRLGDPGSEIWKTVAIPWMERLGIPIDNTIAECFGEGRRIPHEWNQQSEYKYYEKPRAKKRVA